MSSDPKESVLKYLKENGYMFEMKVASEFQKNGIGIHQSVYFEDPYTSTPREIDLIGIYNKKMNDVNFNVIFVIECKYAKSPWVVFSTLTKGFPLCYTYNEKGKAWLTHLIKQPHFDKFFERRPNYGYGITVSSSKADDTPKDNAYKAVQSVLSFLKSEAKTNKFSTRADFTFFVPVIVIKGQLFEAKLNIKDEIFCQDIQEAHIFYKESIGLVSPKIHIVTDEHLKEYIEGIKEDCERLFINPYFELSIISPPLSSL